MKLQIKKTGLLLISAITFFSCSPPTDIVAAMKEVKEVTYKDPTEIIKNMDYDTATNWYGILQWKPPVGKNENLKYRLKVWQLKIGQDNFTAIRENAPVLVMNLNNSYISNDNSGFITSEIPPINTFTGNDMPYTKTCIYLIETFDNFGQKVSQANSYRYSRSNKQRG